MNWIRGHTIGHGSSSSVSIAVSHQCDDIFAVKSAELSQSELLQREQKIMPSLSSPHIVAYKGCDITMENNKLMFNLMMEYVPGGTLTDAIRKQGGQLDESMISYYTRQIVQGLEYLHSNRIVHCDVKGRNILLAESGVKICDFGCSKPLNSGDQQADRLRIGGTPMFMAPEAARGEEQGFPADIWALGCTIIEMATGGSPWPNVTTPASVLYQIAFSGELPKFPDFLSEQAKDFLSKCLRRDPKERWTAKQLPNHPFLDELNPNAKRIQEFDSSSPTSILDQGIWSSVEESESSCEMIQSSLSNSPCQRIKTLSLNSGKANWKWDDTWITIRISKDERGGEEDMVACGSTVAFTRHDMDLESRGSSEKLMNSIAGCVSCCNHSCSSSLMSEASIEERHKQKPVISQFQFQSPLAPTENILPSGFTFNFIPQFKFLDEIII